MAPGARPRETGESLTENRRRELGLSDSESGTWACRPFRQRRSGFGCISVFAVTQAPLLQVRISRKRILESAVKVMEMYAGSRAVLELEYFNEAGTGLGPTLEFYTLLSHELQKKGLHMWRSDDGNTEAATGRLHTPAGTSLRSAFLGCRSLSLESVQRSAECSA